MGLESPTPALAPGGLRDLSRLIPAGGVSRWEFEQSPDDSWDANGGSVTGATYTTTAIRGGYSLDFDGSGDEFVVPHDSSISYSDDFTISVWINFDGLTDDYPRIITKGQGDGGNYELYYHTGDNEYRFNSSNTTIESGVSRTDGTWTHLVGRVDSGTGSIFINGDEKASGSFSAPENTEDLFIGSKSGSGFVNGQIDDPRIYDSPLSDSRITDIFNGDE